MNDYEKKIECKILNDPIFSAILGERGGRKIREEIIKNIEKMTKFRFISYISLINAKGNNINPDDIQPLSDVIYASGRKDTNLMLMLNSPGGLPDVAEKILELCRSNCLQFKIVVPVYAKSAATLLCFGSDQIIMSDTSELGPIDPQMVRQDVATGRIQVLPAHAYIDSYEEIVRKINTRGKLLPADIPILNNIDIAFINRCKKAVEHSRTLAEKWLAKYMFKGGNNKKAKGIAKYFARDKGLLSHAKVITWKEAKEKGLNIDYLPREDNLWKLIWELYIRSELFLRETKQVKLFECNKCSLAIKVG